MSSSSTAKKRPKPASKSPKPEPNSSSSSLSSIVEPPQNFFPAKEEFLRLIAVLAIASSVLFACSFIAGYFNPSAKPFCDSNIDSADAFLDSCEPCPENGECYEGKLECSRGFRKHGSKCLEDGDINESAKKISEWIENRLCEAYANFLCHGVGKVWVHEDDIWNDLEVQKLMGKDGTDNLVYTYTKRKAMEAVDVLLETRTKSSGTKELKCPDQVAEQYKPYTCRIRQWIYEHALVISPIIALVVASMLVIRRVRRRWYLSIRAEELYRQVCDILEENALTSKGLNGECEPWVVASRLRDHLLLPRERKNHQLWKKVEELVQEDSRVDRYPKLVKGESKVVWEWQVEGSLSSARMRQKVEARKLKSSPGIQSTPDQQHHAWKSDPQKMSLRREGL